MRSIDKTDVQEAYGTDGGNTSGEDVTGMQDQQQNISIFNKGKSLE